MKINRLFSKKHIYYVLPALLVVLAIAYPHLRRIEVQTAPAVRGTMREYVFEEARTRLDVIRTVSAPLTGLARRIDLEVGDEVTAGQIITTMEDDEILHSIAKAKARIRELEARIENLTTTVPKEADLQAAANAVEASSAAVNIAGLQMEKSAAELNYQEKQYERVSRLLSSGVATQEEYDQVLYRLKLARSSHELQRRQIEISEIDTRIAALNLEAMEESLRDIDYMAEAYSAAIEQINAELDTLRLRASKTSITSPLSGILTAKHLDSETAVQAGAPLAEIGYPGSIEIKTDILSADIAPVRPGQEAVIQGGILGERTLEGVVGRIYPHGFTKVSALGIEQQRFRVIIAFDNSEARLPPGADVDVRIIIEQKENTLHVPAAAVFMTADGPAVFKSVNGTAVLTHIGTGLAGDDRIEVVSGLEEGDAVILRPPPELSHGSRIAAR